MPQSSAGQGLVGRRDLVAGGVFADPARAAQSAADLGIAAKRGYDRWAAMAVTAMRQRTTVIDCSSTCSVGAVSTLSA